MCLLSGNVSRLNYVCALMMLNDCVSKKKQKKNDLVNLCEFNTIQQLRENGLLNNLHINTESRSNKNLPKTWEMQ